MGEYLRRTGRTILRVFVIYAPLHLFMSLCALFALPGLFGVGRFLYFYVTDGGAGHIQSVVLSGVFLAMATMMFAVGILAAFVILAVLAYYRNVNWDEFYFLSHVHAWLDGRLDRPMQTGFVYAFGWLDRVPGYEMQQIFAARLVMIGCLGVTAWSIPRIARHFTTSRCATLAVLAFLCAGFTLPHGGSFRSDPIAAALLTSSLAIAVTCRMATDHITWQDWVPYNMLIEAIGHADICLGNLAARAP